MSHLPWDSKVELAKERVTNAFSKLNKQDNFSRRSQEHLKLTSEVRLLARQINTDITILREELNSTTSNHTLTQGEVDRRQLQLDNLSGQCRHLEKMLTGENRDDWHSSTGYIPPKDPWDIEDDDMTRGLGIGELREQQQQVIKEQDKGLSTLAKSVSRQKEMAVDINRELSLHNEIIDDIHDHVDRTDERLIRETRHVTIVNRKSGACALWVIIFLLFIGILVLAFVPVGDGKT